MFEKKTTTGLPNDPSVLIYMRSISTSDIEKPDVIYVSDWFDEWIVNYTMHLQPQTIHHSDAYITRKLLGYSFDC